MKQASDLFRQIYRQHHNIEICIAELKRNGFSQVDTVKAIIEVGKVNIAVADRVVSTSPTWKT